MTMTRRNVATGAVWALPALTVVQAAPALAASCDPASNLSVLTLGYSIQQDSEDLPLPSDDAQEAQRTTFILRNLGPAVAPQGAKVVVKIEATVPDGYTLDVSSDMTTDIVKRGTPKSPVYLLTYTLPADVPPGSTYAYAVDTVVHNENGEGFYTVDVSSTPVAQQRLVRQCDTLVLEWDEQA